MDRALPHGAPSTHTTNPPPHTLTQIGWVREGKEEGGGEGVNPQDRCNTPPQRPDTERKILPLSCKAGCVPRGAGTNEAPGNPIWVLGTAVDRIRPNDHE
jgi:hypothetical protein